MKKIVITLAFSLLAFVATAANPVPPITIAVAANMQFAMKTLTHNFTKKTGIQCNFGH